MLGLCCRCCKKREPEVLRLNIPIEEERTLRVQLGSTELESGEWFSWAQTRNGPVPSARSDRSPKTINSSNFRGTSLCDGRAVATRQRALATPVNIFALTDCKERPPNTGFSCRKEPEAQWFRVHRDQMWTSTRQTRLASDESYKARMHEHLQRKLNKRAKYQQPKEEKDQLESTALILSQNLELLFLDH